MPSSWPKRRRRWAFICPAIPWRRHAELLQALATHKVADLATLPEKTEVILGGIIANVQAETFRRAAPGSPAWPSSTFEDLSGTTPAMLWPEEFAKMGDLVSSDLIGWVKGTIDRRRDPAELIDQPDHTPRARARRADARGHRAAAQGNPPDRTPRAVAARRAAFAPATSTFTWRSSGLSTFVGPFTRPARRCASATTTA